MDSIDRGIILDLQRNCRVTYKTLSLKYGITSNAIRKRVERLIDTGVVDRFLVQLSRAMADSELMFALLYSDKSITDDELAEVVFNNPLVVRVHYDSYGTCVVHAEYIGVKQMSELSSFFRGLESVKQVEIHTLPVLRGSKVKLSNLHLRVLAPLLANPRMPISENAKQTGLTARKVRRALTELTEGGGVEFTISSNLSADDATFIAFRIQWNPKVIGHNDIEEKIRDEFPIKTWRIAHSATEPLMWCDFLVEHTREAESIGISIRNIPSVLIESTIITYPPKKTRSLREGQLRALIINAGFEISE